MSSTKTNKSEEHKKKISESVKRYHQSRQSNTELQTQVVKLQSQITKLESQQLNSNSIDKDTIIEHIFRMQTRIKQNYYQSQSEIVDALNQLLKSIT